MSWSTHRTTEMPAVPTPVGRHRKRRLGRIGIGAALALVVVAVAGAMVSPSLFGLSSAPVAVTSAGQSTVAGSASGTPTRPATTAGATKNPGSTATWASGPPPAAPMASFEDSVIALANAERLKNGCGALHNDKRLHEAARAHSMDMARYHYYSHTGRDGSDPGERMRAASYDISAGWAENIARGYPTPAIVMAGWMGSKPHRDNILNCGLRAIGLGAARAADGVMYWTQDFGGR